jgi:hypothetical protein
MALAQITSLLEINTLVNIDTENLVAEVPILGNQVQHT